MSGFLHQGGANWQNEVSKLRKMGASRPYSQPQARAGWAALTPAQRRGHLLGIFYYASPEAQERRVARALDDALKAANRLKSKPPAAQ